MRGSGDHIAFPKVYYGGDYNPDQWPEDIWLEDMRLFRRAGISIATLPVFSWARLQPSETEYDFGWLDRNLDLLATNGIDVCLATSTAAQPAWMSLRYPEVLPVDSQGRKHNHGGRVNFCPNSPVYRDFAARLVRTMAERYKSYPGLALWHVGNEYGNYCYCEKCAQAFRNWARERHGSIAEVNRAWNLAFWGHTVYSWEEIVPPSDLNGDNYCFQGMLLDYMRFMSDSSLACYRSELAVLREITPDVPVTTNLMGTFKPLNYFAWAQHLDVVSWDNYPRAGAEPSEAALRHDLMRGLRGGQPFMLMEQTPSQQNWQAFCSLKPPGVMRLWSYQAVAHGADTVMFFQLRRSRGAAEKYHGAVIAHAGHENTRVFRECEALGRELESLGTAFIGARAKAEVAIVFDWENWWAVEASSGPSRELRYLPQIEGFYAALHSANVAVDMIRPGSGTDLSQYKLVLAPLMYMVQPGFATQLDAYVAAGGTFVTTFFSGIVDDHDLVTLGGHPGELRELLGIWVEEIDSLYPSARNGMRVKPGLGLKPEYECGFLCDIIHLEGAEALATYTSGFYAGSPALTVNAHGTGKAYYIATQGDAGFVRDLTAALCDACGVHPVLKAPEGVEVTKRCKDGAEYLFVLNHSGGDAAIDLPETCDWVDLLSPERVEGSGTGAVGGGRLLLAPYGVAIVTREG